MTDPILLPEPEAEPVHGAAPGRHRGGLILLVVVGLVLLIGGALYWLAPGGLPHMSMADIRSQSGAPEAVPAAPVPFDAARVAALQTEIDHLDQRVATLEQRTAPVAPALPAAILAGAPAPPSDTAVTALDTRMDALSARQDRLDAAAIGNDVRLRSDEARLDAAGNQAQAVAAVTDRTGRLARLAAAQAALSAGLPLGAIANAPATLDRYRTEPPPTEAQLRLSFPAAAASARAAARTDTTGLGFWAAMRRRIESLVTIRRGDRVLIGNSQIGVIDQTRTLLEAGDLAGAVAALGRLDGPAAQAMAAWEAQAKGLLAARAALAMLASQS